MTFVKLTGEAEFNRAFGGAVRFYRKQRKMTMQTMSDKMGINKSSISKIEHGTQGASSATLIAISNALEVHVSALYLCAELT